MCRALIVAAMLGLGASAAAAEVSPSRAPEQGCAWKPFQGLGLRLLVQDCTDDSLHYLFSVKGDWIEQHRPSDDRTFGSHQVIRVLSKPADMPIEQAVMKFAAPTLPAEAKGHCAVAKAKAPFKDPNKAWFTLQPTGAYARKIDADLEKGPRDFGCGQYGAGQQTTYFEYHPNESRTRFLFVVVGWDEPLFDEQNIQIGEAPK